MAFSWSLHFHSIAALFVSKSNVKEWLMTRREKVLSLLLMASLGALGGVLITPTLQRSGLFGRSQAANTPSILDNGLNVPGRPEVETGSDVKQDEQALRKDLEVFPYPVPPKPPKRMSVELRSDEFYASEVPYYAIGYNDISLNGLEAAAAEQNHRRRVFRHDLNFGAYSIPLPPGDWTTLSTVLERPAADGTVRRGAFLARMDGHEPTGYVLVRSGESLTPLQPNSNCAYVRRYARGVLQKPQDGQEECWFINRGAFAYSEWDLDKAPLPLLIGKRAISQNKDHFPSTIVGATYFRAMGKAWEEVTYFFDTDANDVQMLGVSDVWAPWNIGNNRSLQHFVIRDADWLEKVIPVIRDNSAHDLTSQAYDAMNEGVPE